MLSTSLCSRSLLASHEEVLLTRHAVQEGTPEEALRTLAYEQAIHLGESREDKWEQHAKEDASATASAATT